MLRDLTGSDWQEILRIPPDRLPQVAVLRGTRNLRHWCAKYEELLSDVVHVGSPNGILDDILLGRLERTDVAYASVYGPAMASEVAHVFASMGVRLILQTGCCGAWGPGVRAGDIFVARRAGCGDGASRYYTPEQREVSAGADVVDVVASGLPSELSLHVGGLYTTAALFAEGREEVAAWAAEGWEAVDLETATTLSVAQSFGVRAASLLYVFDNPMTEGDLVLSSEEKNHRREIGNAAMMDATLRVVASLDTLA